MMCLRDIVVSAHVEKDIDMQLNSWVTNHGSILYVLEIGEHVYVYFSNRNDVERLARIVEDFLTKELGGVEK